MRSLNVLSLCFLAFLGLFVSCQVLAVPARASAGELRSLKKTIGLYFQGRKRADLALLQKAFAPQARLFFVKSHAAQGKAAKTTDEIFAIPLSAYLKKVRSDGPKHVQTGILQLDITKNIAFAKTRFQYEKATYIDYLTLLKKDGDWKIISKTFVKVK